MNGEIKIICNDEHIEVETHLEGVDYMDRMHLMNVMLSITGFNKEDLLLFMLSYDEMKDAVKETKFDLSNLFDSLRGNADAEN